jgi:hypothetical protein
MIHLILSENPGEKLEMPVWFWSTALVAIVPISATPGTALTTDIAIDHHMEKFSVRGFQVADSPGKASGKFIVAEPEGL